MKRRYRIFDYTWHIAHQYDMIYALREDCDFYHCLNIKKQWDACQRPKPANLSFVAHYEPDIYDVAILHIDQELIIPGIEKRLIYEQFDKLIRDIPKIVLNHGTPVFPERFQAIGMHMLSRKEMEQECIRIIKDLVGKNAMVVNSYASASEQEWGFGHPIVHGINPNDWWDLPKEPRVFTALSPFGFDEYYNRNRMIEVSDILSERYGYPLSYARINVETGNSPDDYKNYLGRSLLYLDTSFRTPMNRARTEAFLSGCCVIQVEGAHDLERWAKNGENIILVPDDAACIAATVADLINNNYQKALQIGRSGKQMAAEMFSPTRYRQDWLTLLEKVRNKKQWRQTD